MSGEKRGSSIITRDRFLAYLAEADRLVALARRARISPFAAALAGVGFIRNALGLMGGDAAWWVNLITSTKANPLEEYTIKVPPGGHVPRGDGST